MKHIKENIKSKVFVENLGRLDCFELLHHLRRVENIQRNWKEKGLKSKIKLEQKPNGEYLKVLTM